MIKRHITTLILFLLGSITIVALFFIFKTIIDIKYLSESIYQQRMSLEEKYIKGLSLKDTVKQLEETKEELESLANILLPTNDTLTLITDLEQTAEFYNINQNINLTEASEKKPFSSSEINITVSGPYDQVLSYLTELNRKPYYINIHVLKITTINNESNKPYINLSLKGLVYWQKIK